MRVGLVLGPSTGGIGQHVASLASRLADAGCDVTVAGPAATRDRFGFAVPFVPLEITGLGAPMRHLGVARAARPLLNTVDIVHAHGHAASFVAVAAVRRSVPLVVTWHNVVLATGPRAAALRGVRRGVVRRADVVLGASSDLVEEARRLGASDARLAPVAAPPLPPPLRTPEAVRAELGVSDRPLILAIGRLAPQKGYGLLLDVADELASRPTPPLIAVAGEGPERESLTERIEAERLPVALLGHRTDVSDLLAAADTVLLTSRWEARALVAQEALRAGVPLVATAVGGVPELVGDAALLVPYGDGRDDLAQDGVAQDLAGAVRRVLDEPMLARRLASAGPKQAATWPDEDDTAAHLLAIYRELYDRS